MHEISLVRNIFRSLKEEFDPQQITSLKNIHIKVGELSNIEPQLMHNAYQAVTATDFPEFKEVELSIEKLGIKINCLMCNHVTEIQQYKFICENCGRPSKEIIQGDEMLISGVDFYE